MINVFFSTVTGVWASSWAHLSTLWELLDGSSSGLFQSKLRVAGEASSKSVLKVTQLRKVCVSGGGGGGGGEHVINKGLINCL